MQSRKWHRFSTFNLIVLMLIVIMKNQIYGSNDGSKLTSYLFMGWLAEYAKIMKNISSAKYSQLKIEFQLFYQNKFWNAPMDSLFECLSIPKVELSSFRSTSRWTLEAITMFFLSVSHVTLKLISQKIHHTSNLVLGTPQLT